MFLLDELDASLAIVGGDGGLSSMASCLEFVCHALHDLHVASPGLGVLIFIFDVHEIGIRAGDGRYLGHLVAFCLLREIEHLFLLIINLHEIIIRLVHHHLVSFDPCLVLMGLPVRGLSSHVMAFFVNWGQSYLIKNRLILLPKRLFCWRNFRIHY